MRTAEAVVDLVDNDGVHIATVNGFGAFDGVAIVPADMCGWDVKRGHLIEVDVDATELVVAVRRIQR